MKKEAEIKAAMEEKQEEAKKAASAAVGGKSARAKSPAKSGAAGAAKGTERFNLFSFKILLPHLKNRSMLKTNVEKEKNVEKILNQFALVTY